MNGEWGHYKDASLDALALHSNVAAFVSFGPDLQQRHAWIRGYSPNHAFPSPRLAIQAILKQSAEHSVNIRSFEPNNPKSREFIYGLREAETVIGELRRLAEQKLYTIVNETIDVNDGGVSGVAYGDVIEFAPGDTPRCVEKPGTASLTRSLGMKVLRKVYGIQPSLPDRPELRVEFSLHALRRGYRHSHTIIWEIEEVGPPPVGPLLTWPNLFSRWIGDKAFGLLIAHLVDLPVPRTHVIGRRIAPFAFGTATGLAEAWLRTCPSQPAPGKFTTRRGWLDPFRLLQEEDPGGEMIASILWQQGVDAQFSGALVTQIDGGPLIEGVSGPGDEFMAGRRAPEKLPERVLADVLALYRRASEHLGPVRFEWVHDGDTAWIVQLHRSENPTAGLTIFPGETAREHYFHVREGIEALRRLIAEVQGTADGIVLVGHVGVTSHLGDLLRQSRIPSRLERRS